MSVTFPPAILGTKGAAPILWAPDFFGSFSLKTPMLIEFLLLGGEGLGVSWRGGGSANFIFMRMGIFRVEFRALR